jgi:UPF0755 protein
MFGWDRSARRGGAAAPLSVSGGTARNPRRSAGLVLGGLVGVALLAVFWPSSDSDELPDAAGVGTPVVYEVVSGQSVRSVGDDLLELDVIESTVRFRRLAEAEELARVLRPGIFELTVGMGSEAAVATLASGPVRGVSRPTSRVQVIEGLLLEDTLVAIASALDAVTLEDLEAVIEATRAGSEDGLELPAWWPEVTADDADPRIERLEALLWPETYEVFADASAREVLQRLVDQTVREMERITDGPMEVAGAVRTPYELLTIASLIERETRIADERALVAGVIYGRLADGMRLQIDATLSYAKGDLRAIPLDVDRQSDHPYNTYRIVGLPPGPISGVGRGALMAAAEPEQTATRFYVSTPECDGRHVFAVNYAEHLRNVSRYRTARDAGACQ